MVTILTQFIHVIFRFKLKPMSRLSLDTSISYDFSGFSV